MENIKFSDLGLNDYVLNAINDMGFEEPSQIQAEAIPVALQGYDIIGQAQTGTGKTVAFGVPIINNIVARTGKTQAIILTPTRELAIQVNDEIARISKYAKLSLLPVYGGQPIERQIRSLQKGIDLVVGTPGRVLDHIKRGTINLQSINFLVIDEADEMLDMGFIDDMEEIIKNLNPKRQTLLFSATMPYEIKKLSSKYMKPDTKLISIMKNTLTVSKTKQFYYEIKQKDRFESFCRILDVEEPETAIIFCKTKKGVDELVSSMQSRGYNVEGMHGDINQNQRLSTLKKFKEGSIDFLVATDVAARGIDVENVTHVINYDLPQDTESYVHRIGRTGRANKEGIAYSLVTPREYMALKQIEKATKSKVKRKEIPTIDDIYEIKYQNMLSDIRTTISEENYKKFIPLAAELDEDYNLVDVAAALMKIIFEKELNFDYTENSLSASSTVRLFLSAGKIDSVNPKKILQFLGDTAEINTNEIGSINILEKFSFVDVPERYADVIIKKCSGKKINSRKVNIEIANSKK
ncbi:MAG: DEAD/DEAH box helicase [Bacillota bacterium]|nr:DEAD/DEAH box helicase [Bacillota bacterium]